MMTSQIPSSSSQPQEVILGLEADITQRLESLFRIKVDPSLQLNNYQRITIIGNILRAYDETWELPDLPLLIGKPEEALHDLGKEEGNEDLQRPCMSKKSITALRKWLLHLDVGHYLSKGHRLLDEKKFGLLINTLMERVEHVLGAKLRFRVRSIMKKERHLKSRNVQAKIMKANSDEKENEEILLEETTDLSDKCKLKQDEHQKSKSKKPSKKGHVKTRGEKNIYGKDELEKDDLSEKVPPMSGKQLPRTPFKVSNINQDIENESDQDSSERIATSFQTQDIVKHEEEEREKEENKLKEAANAKKNVMKLLPSRTAPRGVLNDTHTNENKSSKRNVIPAGSQIPRTPEVIDKPEFNTTSVLSEFQLPKGRYLENSLKLESNDTKINRKRKAELEENAVVVVDELASPSRSEDDFTLRLDSDGSSEKDDEIVAEKRSKTELNQWDLLKSLTKNRAQKPKNRRLPSKGSKKSATSETMEKSSEKRHSASNVFRLESPSNANLLKSLTKDRVKTPKRRLPKRRGRTRIASPLKRDSSEMLQNIFKDEVTRDNFSLELAEEDWKENSKIEAPASQNKESVKKDKYNKNYSQEGVHTLNETFTKDKNGREQTSDQVNLEMKDSEELKNQKKKRGRPLGQIKRKPKEAPKKSSELKKVTTKTVGLPQIIVEEQFRIDEITEKEEINCDNNICEVKQPERPKRKTRMRNVQSQAKKKNDVILKDDHNKVQDKYSSEERNGVVGNQENLSLTNTKENHSKMTRSRKIKRKSDSSNLENAELKSQVTKASANAGSDKETENTRLSDNSHAVKKKRGRPAVSKMCKKNHDKEDKNENQTNVQNLKDAENDRSSLEIYVERNSKGSSTKAQTEDDAETVQTKGRTNQEKSKKRRGRPPKNKAAVKENGDKVLAQNYIKKSKSRKSYAKEGAELTSQPDELTSKRTRHVRKIESDKSEKVICTNVAEVRNIGKGRQELEKTKKSPKILPSSTISRKRTIKRSQKSSSVQDVMDETEADLPLFRAPQGAKMKLRDDVYQTPKFVPQPNTRKVDAKPFDFSKVSQTVKDEVVDTPTLPKSAKATPARKRGKIQKAPPLIVDDDLYKTPACALRKSNRAKK